MAGVILWVFVVMIMTIVVIIVNLGVKILKDIGWWKNFTWWPWSHKDNDWRKNFIFARRPKYSCDIEGALDRWHDRELDFQRHEAEAKIKKNTIMKLYMDTRITLQDVQDYVKVCPPLGQTQSQCTGCHIACKDDCNHTCGGKCSTVCNSSCHFACVGVCGGGCSGEANALGVDMF